MSFACELLLSALVLTTNQSGPEVSWSAPKSFYDGVPYIVRIEVTAPKVTTPFAAWLLSPSAFTIDNVPLVPREDATTLTLPPGARLAMEFDLSNFISDAKSFEQKDFKLAYAKEYIEKKGIDVTYWQQAEDELDFMTIEEERLDDYNVVFITNRGNLHLEFWPDVAPNHVRNFLDLSYTKFYQGSTFHRVMPGFMIQGGDPDGTGGGKGPRTLPLEPSDRLHVAGVLSMAREDAEDSASCQFFIMHGAGPHLDGKYTAFGRLIYGSEVVDRIATTRTKANTTRPQMEQVIEKVLVLRARQGN